MSVLCFSAAAVLLGLARSAKIESGGGREVFKEDVVRHVRNLILANYVENVDDFDRKLYYGALRGMTDVLDPHSSFLTPQERKELEIRTSGKLGGLGIVVEKPGGREGPIVVLTQFADTPASRAGIRPGDYIVEIDGKPTAGMDISEAVGMLRGEPGTGVRVKIQHAVRDPPRSLRAERLLAGCRIVSVDGQPAAGMKESQVRDLLRGKGAEPVQVTVVPEAMREPEDIEIVRAEISVPGVEAVRMTDPVAGIGYVRLAEFQNDAPRRLAQAIKKLRAEGMRALVLDLRGNPGGVLDAAIGASSIFLDRHTVVVSRRARGAGGAQGKQTFDLSEARDPYTSAELPLAVLVDGSSASAAEILAAAVRDNGRGIVVGTRTFGKGSVQKVFMVDLGADPETHERLAGSLKLTTEKYYTPANVCIQREPGKDTWGVEPDFVVETSDDEMDALRRQWEKDRLAEYGGMPPGPDSDRAPDPVLDRALAELRRALAPSAEPGGAGHPAPRKIEPVTK